MREETQKIIDYIKTIDYSNPVVNKEKIQQNFDLHLQALHLPIRPVKIFNSLMEGFKYLWAASRAASWDASWAACIEETNYDHPNYEEWKAIAFPMVEILVSGIDTFWIRKEEIIAVITPKLFVNKEGRLHADGKAAVQWEGEQYYFLNGTKVPEYLAITPSGNLNLESFFEEKNADIRTEFLRKYGVERLCTKERLIDSYKNYPDNFWYKESEYELYDLSGILTQVDSSIVYAPHLKMKHLTMGMYVVEGVTNSCKTVKDALDDRTEEDTSKYQIMDIK